MYVGFALSSTEFMLHGLLIHGWEVQNARMSFVWVGWMAVANLVGAAVYVARVRNTFLSLISGC
jgi:adiponectin receptor